MTQLTTLNAIFRQKAGLGDGEEVGEGIIMAGNQAKHSKQDEVFMQMEVFTFSIDKSF